MSGSWRVVVRRAGGCPGGSPKGGWLSGWLSEGRVAGKGVCVCVCVCVFPVREAVRTEHGACTKKISARFSRTILIFFSSVEPTVDQNGVRAEFVELDGRFVRSRRRHTCLLFDEGGVSQGSCLQHVSSAAARISAVLL